MQRRRWTRLQQEAQPQPSRIGATPHIEGGKEAADRDLQTDTGCGATMVAPWRRKESKKRAAAAQEEKRDQTSASVSTAGFVRVPLDPSRRRHRPCPGPATLDSSLRSLRKKKKKKKSSTGPLFRYKPTQMGQEKASALAFPLTPKWVAF
jgi:hypothetical protein